MIRSWVVTAEALVPGQCGEYAQVIAGAGVAVIKVRCFMGAHIVTLEMARAQRGIDIDVLRNLW